MFIHTVNWLIVTRGNLALSRALGDFEFKKNHSLIAEKQVITADPDVTVHGITEEDEFLVLACDGTLRRSFDSTLILTHLGRYLGLLEFAASRRFCQTQSL